MVMSTENEKQPGSWAKPAGASMLALFIGAGGVTLQQTLADLQVEVSVLGNKLDGATEWHRTHESRPHAAATELVQLEAEDRRRGDGDLSARIGALELAIEGLRVRLPRGPIRE